MGASNVPNFSLITRIPVGKDKQIDFETRAYYMKSVLSVYI